MRPPTGRSHELIITWYDVRSTHAYQRTNVFQSVNNLFIIYAERLATVIIYHTKCAFVTGIPCTLLSPSVGRSVGHMTLLSNGQILVKHSRGHTTTLLKYMDCSLGQDPPPRSPMQRRVLYGPGETWRRNSVNIETTSCNIKVI